MITQPFRSYDRIGNIAYIRKSSTPAVCFTRVVSLTGHILFTAVCSLISRAESEADAEIGGNWVNRSSCSCPYYGEIGNASAFFYRSPYPSDGAGERKRRRILEQLFRSSNHSAKLLFCHRQPITITAGADLHRDIARSLRYCVASLNDFNVRTRMPVGFVGEIELKYING